MPGVDLDAERVEWVPGQMDMFGQETTVCPNCFPVLGCEHVPVGVEATS